MERATKGALADAIVNRFKEPEKKVVVDREDRGPYSFTMPKERAVCKNWEKIVKSKRVGGQESTLQRLQDSFMEDFSDECSNNFSDIYMQLEKSVTRVGKKRSEVNKMLLLILELIREKGISLVRSPDMNAVHTN